MAVKREITSTGNGIIISNGYPSARPSGKPRLMPSPRTVSVGPVRQRQQALYTVVLVETVTREAVVEIDVWPFKDDAMAERMAMERLAKGGDAIRWTEPQRTVRATGTPKIK